MAFTNAWDEDKPVGTEDANLSDDYLRDHRVDLGDRLEDMFYGFNTSSNADNEAKFGVKILRFREQSADPTINDAGDETNLYAKNVSNVSELFFRDNTNSARQITTGGKLRVIAGDFAANSVDEDDIQLANNAALTALDAAGTGTVNLILAGTNDLPTLPDSAEMASDAAPVEDQAIVNKKYADGGATVMHDAEGGYNNCDLSVNAGVAYTKTKIYTKYITGTGADGETTIAHGITSGATKILAVNLIVYSDTETAYMTCGQFNAAATTHSVWVKFDDTNIVITNFGTAIRDQAYRLKIDYIL